MSRPSQSRFRPHRWVGAGALLSLALICGACNQHQFLIPAPNLRGITIPLPPPSFADEVMLKVDIEGNVPFGFEDPGTEAYLYEKATGRGYFSLTQDGGFTHYDVLVDVTDNCLEVWFEDIDGQESSIIDYKIELREGAELCGDPGCSAIDEVGACICLEKWQIGC